MLQWCNVLSVWREKKWTSRPDGRKSREILVDPSEPTKLATIVTADPIPPKAIASLSTTRPKGMLHPIKANTKGVVGTWQSLSVTTVRLLATTDANARSLRERGMGTLGVRGINRLVL